MPRRRFRVRKRPAGMSMKEHTLRVLQRAYRKRRSRRRIPTGMPSKKLVKLKYATTVALNPGSTTPDYKYFSCNGMYAPEIVGGHQPLYFDQWMSNYDHYQVIGSAIRITQVPTQNAGTAGVPCLWGCIIDDETTFSYSTSSQIIESNQGRYFRQGNNGTTGVNTAGKSPSLVRKFSAKKQLGVGTGKQEGSTSANPIDQMYFGLWCASPADTSDPAQHTFMVEISYIAVLKEPKFIAQS